VREDIELEVIACRIELVEALEGLGQRPRTVDTAQRESGHGAQGDRVDHPQSAEADRGGGERVGLRAR